jgi:hypothetical protein
MYALATVKFFFFKCAAAAGVWVHRVKFDRTVVVGGSAINVAARGQRASTVEGNGAARAERDRA